MNPSAIFESALSEFRAKLTSSEEKDFEMTRLDDLWQLVNKLQKDQESRRSMQFMRRLEPFLRRMEDYGKVIEVFLNASNFIAFIWVGSITPESLICHGPK